MLNRHFNERPEIAASPEISAAWNGACNARSPAIRAQAGWRAAARRMALSFIKPCDTMYRSPSRMFSGFFLTKIFL